MGYHHRPNHYFMRHFLMRQRQSAAGRCVAVIGRGPAARIAIRIAHAAGAEVSALNPVSVASDRLWLGADYYFASSDEMTRRALEGAFDLIVCTDPDPDMALCFGLLRFDGAVLRLDHFDRPVEAVALHDALTFCGLTA